MKRPALFNARDLGDNEFEWLKYLRLLLKERHGVKHPEYLRQVIGRCDADFAFCLAVNFICSIALRVFVINSRVREPFCGCNQSLVEFCDPV